MYNIGNPITMLLKNIGSSWFGEQQLVINYATIFVIPILDVITNGKKGKISQPTLRYVEI
jgi:hypothetical protein